MSKAFMEATIDNVNAFGTAITFPSTAIKNYDGRELYVHATNDLPNKKMYVTIDNTSPNQYSDKTNVDLDVVLQVNFLVNGAGAPSGALPKSRGGPLTLTARVFPSKAPYGKEPVTNKPTTVTLDLNEAIKMPHANTPVGYVVVKMDDGTGTYQLRWIQNPPELIANPATANLVDNNPSTAGVSGPFGLDTP